MTSPAPLASDDVQARRPIANRSARWAIALSSALARTSITPNQISVLSVVFALIGGVLIVASDGPLGLVLAAIAVQLRLVCNLVDGMVAIEGGKGSKLGMLYNELPDRIADTMLLVAAGYAAGQGWMGWAAALAAALTAYVRVFGGALGLAQSFAGMMAKQQRMAVLTIALLAQAAEWAFTGSTVALTVGLSIILWGSLVTCVTRTLAIARALERS
jgi:phosphatidylglycerophosphate synthase